MVCNIDYKHILRRLTEEDKQEGETEKEGGAEEGR